MLHTNRQRVYLTLIRGRIRVFERKSVKLSYVIDGGTASYRFSHIHISITTYVYIYLCQWDDLRKYSQESFLRSIAKHLRYKKTL